MPQLAQICLRRSGGFAALIGRASRGIFLGVAFGDRPGGSGAAAPEPAQEKRA